MPIGWSWALYFAQEIISEQCRIACGATTTELVRDKTAAPMLSPGKAVIGVHVDNVHTFGGTIQDAFRQHDQDPAPLWISRYSFWSWSCFWTNLSWHNGTDLQLWERESRRQGEAWEGVKLWLTTRALLRPRRISEELLRVWIGHVNFHFLLARPLLSCL